MRDLNKFKIKNFFKSKASFVTLAGVAILMILVYSQVYNNVIGMNVLSYFSVSAESLFLFAPLGLIIIYALYDHRIPLDCTQDLSFYF
ncbi:hypothetical protein PRVXT_002702 [Proteinivorax tanatarense]|uniref:Uncharacterized protein n=1 Tax=Proteinivorax tanatarense TaxID=1260629 RepID=A0AAU7VKM2_9FIRM